MEGFVGFPYGDQDPEPDNKLWFGVLMIAACVIILVLISVS